MRLYTYLKEGKWMDKTMIGLSVNKNPLKPIYNHIEKIFKNKKIPYVKVEDPHITIAQLPGKHEKDQLKRELDKIGPINFKIKELEKLYGYNIKRFFIVLLLKPNDKFIKVYNDIASRYTINKFPGGVKAHISLFSIEQGVGFNDNVFELIKETLPPLSFSIKTTHVDLYNNKFRVEYKDKL